MSLFAEEILPVLRAEAAKVEAERSARASASLSERERFSRLTAQSAPAMTRGSGNVR